MKNPSKYQTAIFDFVAGSNKDGAVIAVPGSGKTTTAVASLDKTSCMDRILFTTFTKASAEDLKSKTPSHVTVSNYNSFGWKMCTQNVKGVRFEKNKTRLLFEKIIREYWKRSIIDESDYRQLVQMKYAIEKLVSLFKALGIDSLDVARESFDNVVEKYDVRIPDHQDFINYFLETFKLCLTTKEIMDYDDQLLYPVKENWLKKEFDLVFIDEFQDTSVLQIEMMLGVGNRIISIGDPDQCIYGFRGAHPDALDLFIKQRNAVRLPLYICYRCPISVIEEARKIVPHIEASSDAKKGTVDSIATSKFLSAVQEGDFVLCRTTAPLVNQCLKMISEGRRAKVKGRDVGEYIRYLVEKVSPRDQKIEDFAGHLNDYQIKHTSELLRLGRESENQSFQDRVESINALMLGCQYVSELLLKIEDIFTEYPGRDYIQFMTVHKSKGLQNDRVFILRPDLLPHPNAKKDWMQAEEQRLKYVAITRAQSELYYVNEERK